MTTKDAPSPPELRPGGPGGRAPQTGIFIKAYLEAYGIGYPAEIHRAYMERYAGIPTKKKGLRRLGTYQSFLQYFARCQRLGLVVFEREEPTPAWDKDAGVGWHGSGTGADRRYYRLTTKGRTQDTPWVNPNRAEAARRA